MRRPPRNLPGTDALGFYTISLAVLLGMMAVVVALDVATVAEVDRHAVGHLPWPIAQWALTTPMGALGVALVSGLVGGLPLGLLGSAGARSRLRDAVDVTDLPATAWPASPLPPWRRPGGPTMAEYLLGRGWGQRVVSLLALGLAVVLVCGFFAALVAAGWYGMSHFPDCVGSRCPPTYGNVSGPLSLLSIVIMFLCQYGVVRSAERRCGIWFRVPAGTLGGFTYYVRSPGVSAEAATAALAHYSRRREGPAARNTLVAVLFFVPFFLVQIGYTVLVAWLATQWSPT